jgi:hypothetical protein
VTNIDEVAVATATTMQVAAAISILLTKYSYTSPSGIHGVTE